MWYQDKNHKDAVASLHSSDLGWILRFYWIEYRQRNETLVNKFIYLDKNEALRVLEKMNYIESGF